MITMEKFVFILILLAPSCKPQNCDWKGGEIIDFGIFCNNDFTIKVSEKDHYLKYAVHNKNGEIVIKQDMNISVIHHWGLFLDSNKNLWVFSSDVGDGVWELEKSTGIYRKRMFYHELTKDEVPQELFNSSLKRFLKNVR